MLNAARLHRLKGLARRHCRGAQEADDLLQDALIVAVGAGRLRDRNLDAWLVGVMRNIASTAHRGAVRRASREAAFASTAEHIESAGLPDGMPADFVASLPPSLRLVAMLAGAGATRAEVRYITGASDMALRQRIAALKTRWRLNRLGSGCEDAVGCHLSLPFGAIRRALLPIARRSGTALASHDPDGHLLAFKFSSAPSHKRPIGGN